MADVTGHGIGPAMLASVCRAYSRASFNARDNLATTIKNINHSFSEDVTPESFATFVAAVFEEGSDQIELLSAGQGPIFIYNARDKSIERINAQILPLGIVPEIEWENPNQELFGSERLAEALNKCSDRELEVIIAELYDAVLKVFARNTTER